MIPDPYPAENDGRLAEAFGASRADVVGVDDLQHRGAHHAGEIAHPAQSDREGGQDQVARLQRGFAQQGADAFRAAAPADGIGQLAGKIAEKRKGALRAEFFAGCSAMAHRLERHDDSYREQRRVLRAAVCAAADELLAGNSDTLSAISRVRSAAIRALDDAAVRGPIRDVVLAEISCAFISAAYLTDTSSDEHRRSEPWLASRCPTNDPERS